MNMLKVRLGLANILLFFALVVNGQGAGNRDQIPSLGIDKSAKRILFLGNSITYSGQYITDIETYFRVHYPSFCYEFINLGLPSETVSGLSEPNHANGEFPRPDLRERLDRILSEVKPDVVFACYGMNDGIYLPLDEKRFQLYKDGMKWLHDKLKTADAKQIVFVTPPVFDDAKLGLGSDYSLVLDEYSKWLLAQRNQFGWDVADVHFQMKALIEEKRKTNPSFKLAEDGVHPGEQGHWIIAKTILQYLGESIPDSSTNVLSVLPDNEKSKEIYDLVSERQKFMKDAWLRETRFERPGMPWGLPMETALAAYNKIENRLQQIVLGKAPRPIRIACIGNSITEGVGVKNFSTESYPAKLQFLLGYDYRVMNFGVSATTAMNTANAYRDTDRYRQALQSNPDIVTIKLGTNDAAGQYRSMITENFVQDYKSIIQSFRQLPSNPRIMLLLPVASYLSDTMAQTDQVITSMVIPRIRQIAYEEKLEVLDLHSITSDYASIFPDELHPNEKGMEIIANRLAEAITEELEFGFDIMEKIKQPNTPFNYHGYDGIEFEFKGRNAKIVKPRVTRVGRPVVWRARFWGHEPQTDIALLDRGFHVVYCDASELFGNAEAIALWNDFYTFLQEAGLSKKVVFEAMSRGAVYAYNWAAKNPDKVASVYADAPVLDLKSWPGGKGIGKGSKEDWEIFKALYGYSSDEEAIRSRNSPIDKVEEIVKGNFPMLHIVGDADDVVPVEENTALFEKEVNALGGQIQVIHKPGVGHHPHSLQNPQPIVDFILKSISR